MSNIRDELVRIQNKYGKLPGTRLVKMLQYPFVYGLDTFSTSIHTEVLRLIKKPEIELSEMEAAFLESFGQGYNY